MGVNAINYSKKAFLKFLIKKTSDIIEIYNLYIIYMINNYYKKVTSKSIYLFNKIDKYVILI